MGRTGKIVLAAATVWPMTYLTCFLTVVAVGGGWEGSAVGGEMRRLTTSLAPLLHAATSLLVALLMVAYPIDALINRKLEPVTRVLWAVLLVVGNVITMPVYFVEHVWPDGEEGTGPAPRGNPPVRGGAKAALGLATFWPAAALLLLAIEIVALLFGGEHLSLVGGFGAVSYRTILAGVSATILLTMTLLLFYVVHALGNRRLDEHRSLTWAIGLVVLHPVTMPIYFLRFVAHESH